MANLDDEFDKDDEAIPAGGLNKKKILFILVPGFDCYRPGCQFLLYF